MLVTFYTNNLFSTQTGGSIQAFLDNTKETKSQPFLLAIGNSKARITNYMIIVDHKAIPCSARTVEAAVDLLFKTHFVFGLQYCLSLRQFWTFVQTAIFEIDIGVSRETPRVREIRSKLLAP